MGLQLEKNVLEVYGIKYRFMLKYEKRIQYRTNCN